MGESAILSVLEGAQPATGWQAGGLLILELNLCSNVSAPSSR